MKPILSFIFTVVCLITVTSATGQTCSGQTFPGITAPSSCTWTYTSTGWLDSLGLPSVSGPTSNTSSESICILVNYTGNFSFQIRGILYVASGAKFSGSITSFTSSSNIKIAGELNLTNTPSISGAIITIGASGIISIPGTFAPGGAATVQNAGVLNIGGDLNMGGQGLINNYADASVIVQGNSTLNAVFNNCGLFELFGTLTTGGGSGLNNQCSTYIHTNMDLNGDFTNDGLLILEGSFVFNGATLYNNGIIVVDNILLNNDNLVGNHDTSLLIVRYDATLSSNGLISGHLFYDMDDQGGFDSVCAGCTEDIDIVYSIFIPPTNAEILANCGGDIIVNPITEKSKLDFDGVDDYLTTTKFIEGTTDVTLMAWVKSDSGNATNMTIAGEDVGCRLWLQNGNIPSFTLKMATTTAKTTSTTAINFDEWHHITGSFTASTGDMKLYVDGVLKSTLNVGATGSVIANSASNGNFEIGRRSSGSGSEYLKGDIDEVRVFNTVLTDDQIQRSVYQEIKNNSGVVKGSVIDKDIVDIATNATIAWADLKAYYPMDYIISHTRIKDYSAIGRITKLKNITSFQEQTAPMPYESATDGDWTTESTWLHGDVWDIENTSDNKDWSIIHIKSNVTTSSTSKTIGLIIDDSKSLTVNGDNEINNSWYLELNGTLDLKNDSQLIQTEKSDLVTSANGKILRRQEGNASSYWYNYWASPVGSPSVSSLIDNNTAANNTNNSTYSLNMLKDGNGVNIQYTAAYTAVGQISTRWMYTYINGLTYYDWGHVVPTSTIEPGIGYTQKGTGNAGTEQQYIFEGKPNNGTILVPVTDVGGPGSETSVSKTDFLLGNPYASALDINKFIDDNIGVIDGTLQLWQQWSGSSHNLDLYDGGYATVNKLGSVRAYQFVGEEGATNGSQDGTKTPSKYLPVGQGFMTEIIATGNVEFNNSQRVFIKEADADGTYDNGSSFFAMNDESSKGGTTEEEENIMRKIRLEFKSVNGPATRRELLLGFSDMTTDIYDYGYEAKNVDANADDLNLLLDGENMVMQAYGPITSDKEVPLALVTSGDYKYIIKITEAEHIGNQPVFLRDNLTGTYFDLMSYQDYEFSSEAGEFNERFDIVFQSENSASSEASLSVDDTEYNSNLIYFNNQSDRLFIKDLAVADYNIKLINMLGQTVQTYYNVTSESLDYGLRINNVSSGAYIVYFRVDGAAKTKQIIID